MSSQGHLNLVVNVEPLGGMVHLVGPDGDPGHEPERFVEVVKDELSVDGIATLNHGPT